MTLWKLALHHEQKRKKKMLDWSLREGRIALGWGKVGNIPQYDSWQEIRTAIRQIDDYRTGLHPSNWIAGGHSLWSFYNEMKKGDLVILVGANSRRELVVEVADESIEWKSKRESATFDDYQHQRNAQIRNDLNADTLWSEAGSSTAQGYSVHWALSKCAI